MTSLQKFVEQQCAYREIEARLPIMRAHLEALRNQAAGYAVVPEQLALDLAYAERWVKTREQLLDELEIVLIELEDAIAIEEGCDFPRQRLFNIL